MKILEKDIFEELDFDILDEVDLDVLDDVDLDTEDKVIYSPEMKKLIQDVIRKEISKLPLGKIITGILSKEADKQKDSISLVKSSISKEITETKSDTKKELSNLRKEIEDFIDKMRNKYDDLKNEVMTINGKQWYQFGGFSPQFNDLNIGDPSIEGAWRIVKSDEDLQFERLESGVWILKGSFTP